MRCSTSATATTAPLCAASRQQLQRLDTVYGALLRISPLVGNGAPYTYGIPASNPFASDGDPATLGEIYAYGFRNAHRLTWSRTGLGGPFISELGEHNLEEVDVLAAGANYGWPVREGNRAINPQNLGSVFPLPANDASFGFTYPAAQYDHEEGDAIAGGFLVEGTVGMASRLHGAFVFGDIVNGRVFYSYASALAGADDGNPATTAFVYELTLLRAGVPTTLLDVVRGAVGNSSLARTDLRFATDLAGNLSSLPSRTAGCGACCQPRLGRFRPVAVDGARPRSRPGRNRFPRGTPKVIGWSQHGRSRPWDSSPGSSSVGSWAGSRASS